MNRPTSALLKFLMLVAVAKIAWRLSRPQYVHVTDGMTEDLGQAFAAAADLYGTRAGLSPGDKVMAQEPPAESTSIDTFQHAMSLLTAISTTTQLFVGLTGAAWAVLVPNTMALPTLVVFLALLLHGLLGFVMFLVLRGLGANLAQRLNLSRWQERYGKEDGMGDAAWFGVPPARYGIPATGPLKLSSWFRSGSISESLLKDIRRWASKKDKNINDGSYVIDRSYAVPRYPTLRIQRNAWPLVPLFASLCSLYLSFDVFINWPEHDRVCSHRFTLLRQASTSIDLDRARYLLDKASCDVSTQLVTESWEHKTVCSQRLAALNKATTPLELDRARYLLDKANCYVGDLSINGL